MKTFINHFEPDGKRIDSHKAWDTPYPTVSVEARKKSVVLSLETNSFLITDPSIIFLQNRIQQNIISIFYRMTENVMQRIIANAESLSKNKIIKYLQTIKKQSKK